MRFLVWKWRKYPIKRDEKGLSLRQQAFELFDKGHRPAEICKQQLVTASPKTLLRYYEDWKKTGGHASSRILQRVRKNNPDFTEQMAKALSMLLEMPIEEVIKRMQKPWGLQQALRGQWPDYALKRKQRDVEARLMGGLRFIRIAKLFQNSPYELAELLLQITMLKDNVKLEITRTEGQLVVTKEEKGRLTTIKLEY
jgi:hypothetical protein